MFNGSSTVYLSEDNIKDSVNGDKVQKSYASLINIITNVSKASFLKAYNQS